VAENKHILTSQEQITNYIHSEDRKKDIRKQVDDIINAPVAYNEMNKSQVHRMLATYISYLGNTGKELIYKKLLKCRIAGAKIEEISKALKITPDKVELLERDAIECVKDKMNTKIITPAIY